MLLLWFYTSGLAILIGAEMNAEIEHASPYGKDPGEKVAGEKKKIGLAAWRQWRERKKKGEPVGPPPEPPRPVAPPPNLAPARPGEMVLGGIIAGALEFIRGRRRVKD